ncbi:MAG: TonB-dependent receptor, partial [Pseudomonadota bacterium]
GNQFVRAPNVTLSLGADYEVIEDLTLGSRVRYVGSYFSNVDNAQDRKAGDYLVADFQISYAYENVEAFAFVNNAFDKFYLIRDLGTNAYVGTPREYGGGLRISF